MCVLVLRLPGLHREAQEPVAVAKYFTDSALNSCSLFVSTTCVLMLLTVVVCFASTTCLLTVAVFWLQSLACLSSPSWVCLYYIQWLFDRIQGALTITTGKYYTQIIQIHFGTSPALGRV